jgi:phospholipid N-methyltransferase
MGVTDRLPDKLAASHLFFRKFLRYGTRVASVAPSSRTLAAAMCAHVDPTRPQTIVELGAGTGAVTGVIARRMHPDNRLTAVEIDPDFADLATARCPRAQVLPCDVRELPQQLEALGVTRIDLLMSGLPTPSLPRRVNRVVFDCYARLGRDGWFSQLTVMPWVYKPAYSRLFEQVDFRLVVRNIPPGGVYHCRGLRDGYENWLPGRGSRRKGTA